MQPSMTLDGCILHSLLIYCVAVSMSVNRIVKSFCALNIKLIIVMFRQANFELKVDLLCSSGIRHKSQIK